MSKSTIGGLYLHWFTGRFEMNEINTKIVLDRFVEIFKEMPRTALLLISSAYIEWFKCKFTMNATNTLILN
jgi:hypothetical protein